jgi:toxin CptA
VQFPINIGLRRSRFLGAVLVTITLLAVGVALVLPWSAAVRGLNVLLVFIAACVTWRRLEPTLSVLRLERSGEVFVAVVGNTAFTEAELLTGATVHPWLTVVRFKVEDGRRHLLIATVDTMNPEDFRRLRVFLRWQTVISAETGAP